MSEVPEVALRTTDGEIHINPFSAVIRIFDTMPEMNHLEVALDEDGQLRRVGLAVGQAVLDQLSEMNFPHRVDHFISECDMNWYISTQAKQLDKELGEL